MISKGAYKVLSSSFFVLFYLLLFETGSYYEPWRFYRSLSRLVLKS